MLLLLQNSVSLKNFAAFVMTLLWLRLIRCIQGYFKVVGQINHLLSQWLAASSDTS